MILETQYIAFKFSRQIFVHKKYCRAFFVSPLYFLARTESQRTFFSLFFSNKFCPFITQYEGSFSYDYKEILELNFIECNKSYDESEKERLKFILFGTLAVNLDDSSQ